MSFSLKAGTIAFVRILVVEDEAALAEQLAAALGAAGYAVDCAADGERAEGEYHGFGHIRRPRRNAVTALDARGSKR